VTPMLSSGIIRVTSALYDNRWNEVMGQTSLNNYDLSPLGYTEIFIEGSRFRFFTLLASQHGEAAYVTGVYYPQANWSSATCMSAPGTCR
jgi:hypothetical protein